MDEMMLLTAIASYGERDGAVVGMLRATAAAELVKRCDWVRTKW